MNKIKVGLIYGGQSFEHEVSLETARSIRENIDTDKFELIDIFIDRDGKFDESLLDQIDVAFLAVHGPNCEDGKLQAFLENRGVKYTGPGVEASRINMNKTVMHDVFKKNGLPTVDYKGFAEIDQTIIIKYIKETGLPVIVKPNNMGSSVGMTKLDRIDEIDIALKMALQCDDSIIIEKAIPKPREIEVAVMGNDKLIISEPGEVLTNGNVYSYETKYLNPFSTTVNTNLDQHQKDYVKSTAEKAYIVTGCKGYSRIDFLLSEEKIYINEINTLPGFTSISMFPKLMANIGIDYKDLITRIINLALEN